MLGWSQRCFYTCKLVVSSLRKSWPRPSQPKSKSQWGVVRFTSCFTHLITSTWMGHSNLLGRKSLPGSISITNFLAHHTMDTVSIRFVQPCGFGLEYNDTCAMVKSSILVQLQNSCGLVVPKIHPGIHSSPAGWNLVGSYGINKIKTLVVVRRYHSDAMVVLYSEMYLTRLWTAPGRIFKQITGYGGTQHKFFPMLLWTSNQKYMSSDLWITQDWTYKIYKSKTIGWWEMNMNTSYAACHRFARILKRSHAPYCHLSMLQLSNAFGLLWVNVDTYAAYAMGVGQVIGYLNFRVVHTDHMKWIGRKKLDPYGHLQSFVICHWLFEWLILEVQIPVWY